MYNSKIYIYIKNKLKINRIRYPLQHLCAGLVDGFERHLAVSAVSRRASCTVHGVQLELPRKRTRAVKWLLLSFHHKPTVHKETTQRSFRTIMLHNK